jgi:hypothetical protein
MYRIAGIDVHKRMLAVVIADVSVEGEYRFERRKVGTSPSELQDIRDGCVREHMAEVCYRALNAPITPRASFLSHANDEFRNVG